MTHSTASAYQNAYKAYLAGDMPRAEILLEEALRTDPFDPAALLLKGVVHRKDEVAVGLSLVDQSVHLNPNDAQAWYNLAVFEAERGRLQDALQAYRRAVQLAPLHSDALGNGCELLRRFDRFEEALEWADRQLALGAGSWAAHLNRAISLFHLRRFDDAELAGRQAKVLAPDRPIIDWEMFAPLLHQKRFAEAWDCFEQRFACGHLNGVFHYPFPHPLWRGEPLTGKSILIHNEQGLGDQIMFASALPEVVAQGGAVSLVVSPELRVLFAASFPNARVFSARVGTGPGDHPPPDWLHDLGHIDYQLPIGGLMALRRRTADSFDGAQPYLSPSQAARKRWKAKLDRDMPLAKGMRVGLCWASNPALFRHDSSRRAMKKSMALDDMSPLTAVKGVQLCSVLNWRIDSEAMLKRGVPLDLSPELRHLDDTAALVEQLDVVVAVDTAVAHLAGALGKPVWLLLHDFADCRWGLEGEKSYWYSSMRLFRQTTPGDWKGVITQVADALREQVRL